MQVLGQNISLLPTMAKSKPSNDGLTKRVCFIGATYPFSLIGPRTDYALVNVKRRREQ